ncbi:sodium-dependent glucose transporter 1A-like [Mytilus edulis]|uniref:sodium-dependent glucose transporter 1A-like n=1 Tax=Mytilus edulis TaxID=6550 RepID=UPI0039EF0590
MEDEDLIYDQTLLLRKETKPSGYSKWCQKFTKTICLSLAFFTLGLCIAIPGPTLLDLGDKINTDTTHMALIFSARSVGYLLGALIGGFLFDILDKQLLLTATLFVAAVATLIIPWSVTLMVLAVMFSLQGVAMGVLDTGGNVFCVRLWGVKSPPYMQALHFAFGIGAFIAPLIAQPFLSNSTSNSLLNGNVPVITNTSLLINYHNDSDSGRGKRNSPFTNQTLDENMTDNLNVSLGNLTTMITITTTVKPNVVKKPSITDGSLLPNKNFDGSQIRQHLDNNKPLEDGKTTLKPALSTLKVPLQNKTESKRLENNGTEQLMNDNNGTMFLNESLNTNGSSLSTTPTNSNGSSLSTTPMNTNGSSLSNTTTTSTPRSTTTTTTTKTPTTNTTRPTTKKATPTTTTPTTTTTTSTPKITITTIPTTTTTKPTTKATTPTITTRLPTTKGKPLPENPKTIITSMKTSKPTTVSSLIEDHTEFNESLTTTSHKPQTVGDFVSSMIDSVKNMSRIQFAYTIIALLLFLSSTLFLVLYCFTKRRRDHEEMDDLNEISMHTENTCIRLVTLMFSFVFFLCYVGMETTFGGLVMTFAVEFAHWTKSQGAIVTSIFWGSLAMGRGFAIFISNCCKPQTMLIVDLIFMMIGALILAFGVEKLNILLWLGTIFLGIGLSSIFPTSVTWIEQYFKITGKSTAVFVTGSAIGQMTLPVATGYLYQTYDKQYLMYIILCLSVLTVILYIIMQCLASKASKTVSSGFLRLDDLDMDTPAYSSTDEASSRKFMPVHNGYDLLMQDADDEL